MKKLICIVAALLMVFACAVPAFAAGEETFEISELDMQVTIPNADQMLIGITDGDYNAAMGQWLAEQGLTEEDFNAYASQNLIYFTAMDPLGSYEYSITSMENSDTKYIYDMAELSDADLKGVMEAAAGIKSSDDFDPDILREAEDKGAVINDVENISVGDIETINGNPYIVAEMDGLADGTGLWIDMYSTIKNGKYIYIRLINYEGPATQEQKDELKTIVQSAEYDNIPAVGKTYASEKAKNPFGKLGGVAVRGAILGGVGALVAGLIAWGASKRKKKRLAEQSVPYGTDMQQGAPRDGYSPIVPPGAQQAPQQQGEPPRTDENNDRK